MAQYPHIKMLIGGEWRERPGTIPIINPCDESVLGTLPQATASDLHDALVAAEKGFAIWRRTSPAKRSELMFRATPSSANVSIRSQQR